MPRGLTSGARHAGGGAVRDVVLVLVLFGVGGLLCGGLWRWLWTPPRGTVAHGVWFPAVEGSDFAATGLYVLIGLGAGLLLGVLSGLVSDRRELLTLGLVVAGSLLAGWVMLRVGELGMPADPNQLAPRAADGTQLPGTLTITGRSPLAAFPAGALVGLFVVFVGLSRKPLVGQRGHHLDG